MGLIELLIESTLRSSDDIAKRIDKNLVKFFKGYYYDKYERPPSNEFIQQYREMQFDGYADEDENINLKQLSEDLFKADPTGGKYANWIVSVYMSEVFEKLADGSILRSLPIIAREDLPKIQEYLELFDKYKHKLDESDVNQYKSTDELFDAVKEFKMKEEEYTLDDMEELADSSEYDMVDADGWRLIFPKSEKTACIFGVNTEWCTAWGSHSRNDDYKKRTSHYRDDLIILISKNDPNEKYQIHFESNQFKDKDDKNFNLSEFFKENTDAFVSLIEYMDQEDIKYKGEFPSDYKDIDILLNTQAETSKNSEQPVGKHRTVNYNREIKKVEDDYDEVKKFLIQTGEINKYSEEEVILVYNYNDGIGDKIKNIIPFIQNDNYEITRLNLGRYIIYTAKQ